MSPTRFVKRFDLATPRFALAIIDLAQIKNRALHHTTTATASAFDNAPRRANRKYMARDSMHKPRAEKRVGLHYTGLRLIAL
jgi:hypothetical protein